MQQLLKIEPNTTTNLKEAYNKLTLTEIELLKRFVRDELGKRSRNTLLNWLNGKSSPSHAEKLLLADFFKTETEKLFPTKK